MAEEKNKKSDALTWKDFLPIILALPLAILVKIFILTSYHVPTASMAPTIIPGDHILVEKWILGPRFYINDHVYRLPGIRPVRRGDILVFNVPKEDSILRSQRHLNYYNWKHSHAGSAAVDETRDSFLFMPIPGRTPFVKRIIGMPGDVVEYRDHDILINGAPQEPHPTSLQHFTIHFDQLSDFDRFKDSLYRLGDHVQMNRASNEFRGVFRIDQLRFLHSVGADVRVQYFFPEPTQIPPDFAWARSLARSGHPVRIPAEGWTVAVDSAFLSQYGQILKRFENFSGRIAEDQLLDEQGQLMSNYTFRQNYYWSMGDNRPYSVDSRSWGLVPEDHVIGIARRTFWSTVPEQRLKSGFRWDRIWERLD